MVRQRFAKPSSPGSNPGAASIVLKFVFCRVSRSSRSHALSFFIDFNVYIVYYVKVTYFLTYTSMFHAIPKTASSKDIQRNYRTLFDEVVSTEEPLVIINNSKPEVVILSVKMYESLNKLVEEHEQEMAKKAIENYKAEKKNGKLNKLSSLADLA